jgi:hypothetical protein
MRICLVVLACFATALLSSCGVYQAFHDDAKSDGFSYFALLSPVTAVTGIYPQTPTENPLRTQAPLVRGRNTGVMTQQRADKIFDAIDRCWPRDIAAPHLSTGVRIKGLANAASN